MDVAETASGAGCQLKLTILISESSDQVDDGLYLTSDVKYIYTVKCYFNINFDAQGCLKNVF